MFINFEFSTYFKRYTIKIKLKLTEVVFTIQLPKALEIILLMIVE